MYVLLALQRDMCHDVRDHIGSINLYRDIILGLVIPITLDGLLFNTFCLYLFLSHTATINYIKSLLIVTTLTL